MCWGVAAAAGGGNGSGRGSGSGGGCGGCFNTQQLCLGGDGELRSVGAGVKLKELLARQANALDSGPWPAYSWPLTTTWHIRRMAVRGGGAGLQDQLQF